MSDNNARFRDTVSEILYREAGHDAEAKALAAAAFSLFGRLNEQLSPLIGKAGVDALTSRSLRLVQHEFPWVAEAQKADGPDGPFTAVRLCLERQTRDTAAQASVATLATLLGVLATLIGEGLTAHLMHTAWHTTSPRQDEQKADDQ